MVSNVRVIHISPEAYCRGEILPHSLILPYALLTVLDERLKTIFLNLLLAVKTKHLLNLKLHRKSVGIPACLTRYKIALHCSVSWNHILDNSCEHMSDMWLTICGRWAIIEHICRAALPDFHALLKYVIVLPELLDSLLALDDVTICRYLIVHL